MTLTLMGVNEHARGDKSRWKKAIEIFLSGYVFMGALMIAIGVMTYIGPH